MANDLNQCNFTGRLGRDPEIKFLPSGSAVANFSIASGEKYKDKKSGEMVEHTEWVRVVAFGRLAEIIEKFVRKGSFIRITGKQKTRKWQGNDGQDRYTTEIVANDMQMLNKVSDQNNYSSGGQLEAEAARKPVAQSGFDDFDDDLNF